MTYTMISAEYGHGKEIESFECSNHQEARKKIVNSQNKYDCVFVRTTTKTGKTKSYSMPEVYAKW
ncbi:MAG: hypothetical protein QME16_00215 [Planctomycetota bacterium]|nr:hypothetical protein [Planctomycetota bacterium]